MNNKADEIGMKYYMHGNEIIRLHRVKLFTHIKNDVILSPSYPKNPKDLKIGVVIGTSESIPYIDLSLHYLKNINGINDILIHDDCSDKQNELKMLCDKYKVDFYSPESKMFYKLCVGSIGDQNAFYVGLKWAKEKKLDILVKISRRLIPLFNWVDNLKQLVIDSQGLTFGSYCYKDNFELRTECIAMNVNAYSNEFVLSAMKEKIDSGFPLFQEFWMADLARMLDYYNLNQTYFNWKYKHFYPYEYSGYVHWYDILGTNRYDKENRNENILWHMYSSKEDYFNAAKNVFGDKYQLTDF